MDSERKVCLICSVPINSIHFGIEACRACTSFFKRSITSGPTIPCRKGSFICDVTKVDKFTCRRCRYEKCLAVGMVYEGPLRRNKMILDNQEAFIIAPSMSTDCSFLDRIGREYEHDGDLFLTMYVPVVAAVPLYMVKMRSPPAWTGSASCPMRLIPISLEETWSMFRKSYPSLRDLPKHEQMELYRGYLPSFTMVESYLHARKVWGTYHAYSMCSETFCINLKSPDSWYEPHEGGDNRRALISTMELCVQDQFNLIVPSLKKAQLKELEEYALFAIMLCETDMQKDASDRLLTAMDLIREETLRDLQRYYKKMGLIDYSARLGNLMTIVHSVRECNSRLRDIFRMQVTLFDEWSTETQLKELLL